jgi:hypothetical protein
MHGQIRELLAVNRPKPAIPHARQHGVPLHVGAARDPRLTNSAGTWYPNSVTEKGGAAVMAMAGAEVRGIEIHMVANPVRSSQSPSMQ